MSFFEGFNAKDLLDIYAGVNAANIAKGTAKSSNLVQELNAQAELETVRGQNELAKWLQLSQIQTSSAGNSSLLIYGALAVAVIGVIVVIRK